MCYVGQTIGTFNRRYGKSGHWWFHTRNPSLRLAVKTFGHEAFEVIILEKNVPSETELDRLECLYIQRYNSLSPNGYNGMKGGKQTRFRYHTPLSRARHSLKKSGNRVYELLDNRTLERYSFFNISEFCRIHKLDDTMVNNVLKGKCLNHQGWSLPNYPLDRTVVKGPTGKIFEIIAGTLKSFCRQHSLVSSSFFNLIHGRTKEYRGWVWIRTFCPTEKATVIRL